MSRVTGRGGGLNFVNTLRLVSGDFCLPLQTGVRGLPPPGRASSSRHDCPRACPSRGVRLRDPTTASRSVDPTCWRGAVFPASPTGGSGRICQAPCPAHACEQWRGVAGVLKGRSAGSDAQALTDYDAPHQVRESPGGDGACIFSGRSLSQESFFWGLVQALCVSPKTGCGGGRGGGKAGA